MAEESKVEKAEKVVANGITRPNPNTKTGRVFEIADEISAAAGEPAKRGEVLKVCDEEGINKATAATQYGRWRKFNGLEGRARRRRSVTNPVADA
jgi:hypothetical protein